MLIGEFAQRTGLSQDTVRFYVRKGLLTPQLGAQGGRNPYQIFSDRDASTVRMIRFAQSLGLPLKEIAEIATELQREGLSPAREIEIMNVQLVKLEQKATQLAELTNYLRAKRDWVVCGKPGDEPRFTDDTLCLIQRPVSGFSCTSSDAD
ncbi:MerR family transcriptional regulator [Ensifer sp. NM-2]|uniref:MerR family transcriptional regulator n=1 Tax=unclassified Ensifer TaxID=2633371 RepID=UPI00070C4222|nr:MULTISPECIES: MerR family transcriptional regulator [unclassified Ensifer]KQU84514.1 MerR family transcriptional regulator [Ensifer sp. Root31]PSS64294.1 MerR family transcriptional regulator [Ensifer sp. NM-2]